MRPAPSFFLMSLYGWGGFIWLYVKRVYYCFLQCAVQESKVLSSIHDSTGQQKGCWAIKNNRNHHQPSCRHFVSEVWGLGRAVLRQRRPFWRVPGQSSLHFSWAPAHAFLQANLPLLPPQNTPASQHNVGSYPKGQRLSSILQTNNPMYARWIGGLGLSYTFSFISKHN